jgi:predicted ATPase
MRERFVVLSGCSGGGKSALLDELRRRGFAVVEEPGRRIVHEELAADGAALPWVDAAAFAWRAIAMALSDWDVAERGAGWTFFDRGLVDAACALQHITGEPALEQIGLARRYASTVFLAPPWPEIHVADAERRHGYDEAVAEYDRLERAFPALGYQVVALPKIDVAGRADFVLSRLPPG